MSDKKISDLVELTSLAADDVLPVVDSSANATKRITGANLTTAVRGDTGTLTLGDGTAISSLGADSFRLEANATSDGTLTAWERVDEPTSAKVGTGVSQSSGTFNVPNSGVWLIIFTMRCGITPDNGEESIRVLGNIDGESAFRVDFTGNFSATVAAAFSTATFVGNFTTTNDITFVGDSVTQGNISGGTNRTATHVTFVRLGDA